MFIAKADRPYFDAWLRRTRRQFAISGRLSQTALMLSREDGGTPEEWSGRLRDYLDGGQMPSLDLLTRIDALLAGRPPVPKEATPQAMLL